MFCIVARKPFLEVVMKHDGNTIENTIAMTIREWNPGLKILSPNMEDSRVYVYKNKIP